VYTKAQIFNLALGALLLQRRIIDPDTDNSNEAKVLQTHWDAAFRSTVEDLNLDSLSTEKLLELIEENPTDQWLYSYRYPPDCAFFRRIKSEVVVDNRSTHIPKRVAIKNNEKCIFTNRSHAVAEYISINVQLVHLSPSAGLAIAYKLAMLSAPLVTGKGANELIQKITEKYVIAKADAQKKDKLENEVFNPEFVDSEFVDARLS